jgi:cell division protein FtsB
MAKNRKNQSAAVRFGPALKAFLLCLFIGGSGVGYVWQKSQINDLGSQILKRERDLGQLRIENEKARRQLAALNSPAYIELRIRELNLGLVQPQPNQIWRMVEPSAELLTPVNAPRPQQFAARQNTNPAMP